MQSFLFCISAGIIFLWGLGHLIPTRNIVSGFGNLSADNRRIITMEWIAEGLMLCFVGVLVAVTVWVIGPANAATHLVARACALMLFIMAGLSAFTGARTSVLPMKLCPYIKVAVAIIYIVASLI